MKRSHARIATLVLTWCVLFVGYAGAQVQPLGHPSIDERVAQLGIDPNDGYRFVVFGDQKSLWKDDFPRLVDEVRGEMEQAGPPLLFMLDTGDIVDDGSKDQQFGRLAELLAEVNELPYLVAVGNHELKPEKGGNTAIRARQNTIRFLGHPYTSEKMYFSEVVGPVRFLFLDTNDLPGVYPDLPASDPASAVRTEAQLEWLRDELAEDAHPTIALSHHAFVQSAGKHRGHATTLWNRTHDTFDGRTLPEMLIEGGVDLVLSGHVHSYEVYRLERLGLTMWSVNASGKPTGSWFRRPWTRMPSDWRGRELDEMRAKGFGANLDEWSIAQLSFMSDDTKRNQYALVTVETDGAMQIELRAVDGESLHTLSVPSP